MSIQHNLLENIYPICCERIKVRVTFEPERVAISISPYISKVWYISGQAKERIGLKSGDD